MINQYYCCPEIKEGLKKLGFESKRVCRVSYEDKKIQILFFNHNAYTR